MNTDKIYAEQLANWNFVAVFLCYGMQILNLKNDFTMPSQYGNILTLWGYFMFLFTS